MLMILMTGLSGAGKSTLAEELLSKLLAINVPAEVIDGDAYRKTINADLSFSADDRKENIRRLCKVACDKNREGVIAIVAAINPFEDLRVELVKQYGAKIIWVKCSLSVLTKRDTKGLYRKALLPDDHPDKLWNLTGVNDPYEIPVQADLVIDTSESSIEACTQQSFNYVSNFI
ncbi:N/A [soil metagenome]